MLSATLIALLRRSPLALGSLDRPNHRSLHERPIPRIGGIAMMIAVACCLVIFGPERVAALPLALAACLALVSHLDDRAHLPITLRLGFHIAAAAAIAIATMLQVADMSPIIFSVGVLTMIAALCWMTNLFNFMDGANGLAGGMAFIGFGGYALAALTMPATGSTIALLASTLSGAALGFLFFNFPVAKVFMGDSGSIPLGFLAAVLGTQGWIAGLWPIWFGTLVFSPFIIDATATLVRRMVRGEKIWIAHRDHYYQRLILSGWSHIKTAVAYYLLMLGSTASALVIQNDRLVYPIIGFWVITYALLLLYLEWRFFQHKKDKTEDTFGVK